MASRSPSYAFGDDRVAGERLALLHEVFGPSSDAFVRAAAPAQVDIVLDLGCGPGHTTAMLARAFPGARVVGVEQSDGFATRTLDGVDVVRHDVTVVPFPTPAADVVYARFLLTHLDDPEACVARWTTMLRPGGRLLLDETERIDTREPAMARYLDLVARVLRDERHELYVGERLDAMAVPDGCRRVESARVEVRPTTGQAASMFLPNLGVWRTRPTARALADDPAFDALHGALASLVGSGERGGITWSMRRIVIERDDEKPD